MAKEVRGLPATYPSVIAVAITRVLFSTVAATEALVALAGGAVTGAVARADQLVGVGGAIEHFGTIRGCEATVAGTGTILTDSVVMAGRRPRTLLHLVTELAGPAWKASAETLDTDTVVAVEGRIADLGGTGGAAPAILALTNAVDTQAAVVAFILADKLDRTVDAAPGIIAVALARCGMAGPVSRALLGTLHHLTTGDTVPARVALTHAGMAGTVS